MVELSRFALGTRPTGRLWAFADWSTTGLVLGREAHDDIAPVPYAW